MRNTNVWTRNYEILFSITSMVKLRIYIKNIIQGTVKDKIYAYIYVYVYLELSNYLLEAYICKMNMSHLLKFTI